MPFWYPVCDHPDAGSRAPWFSTDARGLVHRADGHPMGRSEVPSFRVDGGLVYPTGYDTTGATGVPWFAIVGTVVSPAEGHPLGPSSVPWYQLRD